MLDVVGGLGAVLFTVGLFGLKGGLGGLGMLEAFGWAVEFNVAILDVVVLDVGVTLF